VQRAYGFLVGGEWLFIAAAGTAENAVARL
jgi:hypothetical protein